MIRVVLLGRCAEDRSDDTQNGHLNDPAPYTLVTPRPFASDFDFDFDFVFVVSGQALILYKLLYIMRGLQHATNEQTSLICSRRRVVRRLTGLRM